MRCNSNYHILCEKVKINILKKVLKMKKLKKKIILLNFTFDIEMVIA